MEFQTKRSLTYIPGDVVCGGAIECHYGSACVGGQVNYNVGSALEHGSAYICPSEIQLFSVFRLTFNL